MSEKILVAMSGGVDSSVAAAILKEQGYDVIGVTMKLVDTPHSIGDSEKNCCGYDATRAAKLVADAIGIPHYVINATVEFEKNVISNFIQEYDFGRTPNPCNRCNQYIKFDYLVKIMRKFGCTKIATGHYAQLVDGFLFKGVDPKKDQSYFLYTIYSIDTSLFMFPLGTMDKPETRSLAESFNLPVAQRKESQDICFIPDGDYATFLKKYIDLKSGKIIDMDGNCVGKHTGLCNYTIGQRKGLGAMGKRMYVCRLDFLNNLVVIGDAKDLFATEFMVSNICKSNPNEAIKNNCLVKVRYAAQVVSCICKQTELGIKVKSNEPIRSIAPGQSAVFYDGDKVLGGGIIKEVYR